MSDLLEIQKQLAEARELAVLRGECARLLYDYGHLSIEHDDGCPEDDCCECLTAPLVEAVLGGPYSLTPHEHASRVATIQAAIAAYKATL